MEHDDMGQITVSLTVEELDDLMANAVKPGMEFDQVVADRMRGMAKERTRKKVALVSMKIGGGNSSATFVELPDAVYPMNGRAGVLKDALNTVGAATPFQISIGGAILPVGNGNLVYDDGIATLQLPDPDGGSAAQLEGAEVVPVGPPPPAPTPLRGVPRRRVERENDAGWVPSPPLVG